MNQPEVFKSTGFQEAFLYRKSSLSLAYTGFREDLHSFGQHGTCWVQYRPVLTYFNNVKLHMSQDIHTRIQGRQYAQSKTAKPGSVHLALLLLRMARSHNQKPVPIAQRGHLCRLGMGP